MTEKDLMLTIAYALYDKKAQDIQALKVAHITPLADYLVIASGHNPLQVRALSDHLEEQLDRHGIAPRRVEGRADANWIVLDYQSVIVHLFKADARAFYRLERLWDDGQNRVSLPFEEELQAQKQAQEQIEVPGQGAGEAF